MRGKLSDADIATIEGAKNELKDALATDNTETIKAKSEELKSKLYAITEKLYQNTGASNQGANPDFTASADGANMGNDYYEADYREVD